MDKDYFQLFNLQVGYAIEMQQLKQLFRELQKVVHPDHFSHTSEAQRRMAMQKATQINDAYQTLSDPVKRAYYLLSYYGVVREGERTHQDTQFLMEQMELREALDAARCAEDPLPVLQDLQTQVRERMQYLMQGLEQLFTEHSVESLQKAADDSDKLRFLQRLDEECQALEDELLGII